MVYERADQLSFRRSWTTRVALPRCFDCFWRMSRHNSYIAIDLYCWSFLVVLKHCVRNIIRYEHAMVNVSLLIES
jgi:hypothetical protein